MLHTAEVRLVGDDLSTLLCDMRIWLDHHRSEPDGFRHCSDHSGVKLLVDFKAETEAHAFAKAFGGRMSGASLQAELP